MTFNFIQYFLFLPVVWLLYNLIGQRSRWILLLLASYLFYASLRVPYLLGVIILVTLSTYGFGFWLSAQKKDNYRKWILWIGILVNVCILVVLKYLTFLTDNLEFLLNIFWLNAQLPHAPLLIGIGASYYIFQAISYLNDIYLEIEEPEPHLGYFALYLAFFPKLLQGPIERAGFLLPQLKEPYNFNYENVRYGLLLFSWGLLKKLVLADRLGLYVDEVYGDVYSYGGGEHLLASYAYAFQIYFDFSGYTDMALGTARLFNIRLTDNFNRPYLATSVADFWRRWHVSFSRWILDYIFKPLQMSWRHWGNWGTASALLVTFLVSGIWHGASWGFVVWGLLHGTYLALSVFYRPYQKKIHKALHLKTGLLKAWQVFWTFNLVSFAWIFFRSASIGEAFYIIKKIFLPFNLNFNKENNYFSNIDINFVFVIFIFLSIIFLEKHKKDFKFIFKKNIIERWVIYEAIAMFIVFLSLVDGSNFIYINF